MADIMKGSPRLIACMAVLLAWVTVSNAIAHGEGKSPRHEPIVEELIILLEKRTELQQSLATAVRNADLQDIKSVEEFYSYLDEWVTWIPTEREIVPKALTFYYIVNQAPEDRLNKDEQFNLWMKRFVQVYGDFLDTTASAEGIESFAASPQFKIDDYVVGPSGWLTFNQFFAREIRPGKRPIAAPHNDRVIVSPADAVFMGKWPIDANSTITVKGVTWAISELLDGSPYEDAFRDGMYMHSFLNLYDYHRYHVPVGGTVKEVRNIHGKVYLDVFKLPDGTLDPRDGDTYQFNQERGLVVIDSPEVGLVAVLPIGMGHVSSITLTPEPGITLQKGEQFGYFLFGGSDIVLLFQDKNVIIDAKVGTKYLQGERLGRVQ